MRLNPCCFHAEAQAAAMVDRAIGEFGRLDILVSNAGILIAGGISDFPADQWQAVINVNLIGYFCAPSIPAG